MKKELVTINDLINEFYIETDRKPTIKSLMVNGKGRNGEGIIINIYRKSEYDRVRRNKEKKLRAESGK